MGEYIIKILWFRAEIGLGLDIIKIGNGQFYVTTLYIETDGDKMIFRKIAAKLFNETRDTFHQLFADEIEAKI